MVEPIREILSANGVGAQPVGECPFARARITTTGDGIRVEITDSNAREIGRTVASAGFAATLIESWAREDPTALASRAVGGPEAVESGAAASPPPAPAPAPPASTGAAPPAAAAPSVPIPRAYLDLDGAAGIGFDGSGWFGGGLSGCGVVGPVCLGVGATVGIDPPVSGDSKELETQRLLLELVALLDVPVRFRGFTLRPGIAVGAAFARMAKTVRDENEEEEGEHQGSGEDEPWIVQRWALALGAHVIGAIALGKRFALTVGAAVLALPTAETDPLQGGESSLATVPRGVVRGSVGLEYAL